eukprot:TRINITY_DN1752_c0_g1_i12.p1 TRINITY_DN1752_c0_g1~~TRINITY_DN1752_c0_g1_i12.p1  ORF type:complete len:1018 (-),score=227.81 TRINITY_DN1752_c0_g1_i12:101-3154(-)
MIINRLLASNISSPITKKVLSHNKILLFPYSTLTTEELLLSMPKNTKNLKSLALKKKAVFQRPYKIYWQVIGAGNFCGSTSLFLATCNSCYAFNVGEGTQRIAGFVKLEKSLNSLRNIFITDRSWKNIGGLPGLCLSMRMYGAHNLEIHGPKGCMDIYQATRNFVNLRNFNVQENSNKQYLDNGIEIEKVILDSSEPVEKGTKDNMHPSWELENIYMKNRSIWENRIVTELKENETDSGEPDERSVQAYVCKFLPRAGRLDPEKCVKFGVPPGPLFGELKAGKDITLPNGTTVRARDVLGESADTSSAIVLEVPSLHYIESLLQQSTKFTEAENLKHVFHFTPSQVIQDPRYIGWMQKFPSSVQHIFLNDSCSGVGLVAPKIHQTKMRLMNPELFPPLAGMEDHPCKGFDIQKNLFEDFHGMKTVKGICGLRINERPAEEEEFEIDEANLYNEEEVMSEVFDASNIRLDCEKEETIAEVKSALEYSNSALTQKSGERQESKKYPEVTFLGTASALAGKYRNNTCILVEVKEDHFIIMDCGEGSLGQIFRIKGLEQTKRILKNLKAIYVSHQHADHHLGSIDILQAREKVFKEANLDVPLLYFVVTNRYRYYLTAYHHSFEPVLGNIHLVSCEDLIFHTPKNEFMQEIPGDRLQLIDPALKKEFLDYTSLSGIETCKAVHCAHAYCVSMVTGEGYKFTYSGDTRPVQRLIEMGKGSDLLIHEATMEHILLKDAIVKKHSTFTEAIEAGKEMEAKFTVLTHFSQRYAKMPMLNEIEDQENVVIAFDNLTFTPANIHQIRLLYPALKAVFKNDYDAMCDRSQIHTYHTDDEDLRNEQIEKLKYQYEGKQENFNKIHEWRMKVKPKGRSAIKRPADENKDYEDLQIPSTLIKAVGGGGGSEKKLKTEENSEKESDNQDNSDVGSSKLIEVVEKNADDLDNGNTVAEENRKAGPSVEQPKKKKKTGKKAGPLVDEIKDIMRNKYLASQLLNVVNRRSGESMKEESEESSEGDRKIEKSKNSM